MLKNKINELTKNGSVLVYSLIILSAMLFIVASMSTISVIENKSASSTEFSAQAFQTADSGFQIALKQINAEIKGDPLAKISDLYPGCSGGKVSNLTGAGPSGAEYALSFEDASGNVINNCSEDLQDIASIKSVGVYKGTVRAVQVAVAAGPVTGSITGGCAWGSGWGTATDCSLSAGMTCAAGNTARIMTYHRQVTGLGEWNSSGSFASGFCIKD